MAVFSSLLASVVTYFAIPDDRWISVILLGVAFFDGIAFTVMLPRLTDSGRGRQSELDRMNAEAEALAHDDAEAQPRDV